MENFIAYLQSIGLNQTEINKALAAFGELKAFTFQRTTARGSVQNCYCSADNLLGDFSSFKITLTFTSHESLEEKQRGSSASNLPFVLKLEEADFWREVLKSVVTEDKDKSLLVILSNVIWRLAFEEKFIEDFSEFDEAGKRISVLKSLADLGAIQA